MLPSLDVTVIVLRFLCLSTGLVFAFGGAHEPRAAVGATAAAIAFYAVAYLVLGKRHGLRVVNLGLTAADIVAVSIGIRWTGGLASDTYLFFFVEAIFVALLGNFRWTVGYGTLTAATYWLLVAGDLTVPARRWGFAYRAFMLLFASVGAGLLGAVLARQRHGLARRAEEERRAAEREQAVSRVAKLLTSELDHDRVLVLVLESAVSILGAAAGWVAMRCPSGRLRIVAVDNLPEDLLGNEVSPVLSEAGVLGSGSPAWPGQFAATLSAPIEFGDDEAGLLVLFSTRARKDDAEEQRVLRSLAELAAIACTNARLFAERQRKESHLAILNAIGRRLVETLDVSAAFSDVRRELAKVLPVDAFSVAAYDEQQRELNILHQFADGALRPGGDRPLYDAIDQAVRSGRAVRIDRCGEGDCAGDARPGVRDGGLRSALVVPMLREGRVVGALSVQSCRGGAYDGEHEQLLQTVADQMAVAFENSRLYDQMRRLSLEDWLTGLGNARFFYQAMEREIARAERYGHPLSLIMVDSDLLKEINDRYGHQTGDRHIAQLAEVIRRETRQPDIGIRYAGDEFLVILPETDEASALITAERIRQSVERAPLEVEGASVPVTVSVGIASYPRHGRTADELFRSVDAALYEAKRAGKNRTSLCAAGTAVAGPAPVV